MSTTTKTNARITATDSEGRTWLFVPTANPGEFVSYFKCVWNPELGEYFDDGLVTVRGKPTIKKLLATKS